MKKFIVAFGIIFLAGCQVIISPSPTFCGDGAIQAPNGNGINEECEPPNTDLCDVNCQKTYCGDGSIQKPNGDGISEECEPPNTAACDDKCQKIPHCGDGNVDPGEECEPPNTTTCDSECKKTFCGDGIVQDPNGFEIYEQCDPPDGTTCDDECQNIPHCGDGNVDPGEECDPPDGTTCDDECQNI